MLMKELDSYFRSKLDFKGSSKADSGLNGLQVGRFDKEIRKAAFAVDGCIQSFKDTLTWGADLLFVHHGLFWGKVEPITGNLFRRIKFLMENDICLYGCHLPLDMQPNFGNNAGIAAVLGLRETKPFGDHRGLSVGVQGIFQEPKTLSQVLAMLAGEDAQTLRTLPFGPEKINSAAIISGDAAYESLLAISEGIDLFITGDSSHAVYHQCLEAGIHVIFGGHYNTETWGVRALAGILESETGIKTKFIDSPTGF